MLYYYEYCYSNFKKISRKQLKSHIRSYVESYQTFVNDQITLMYVHTINKILLMYRSFGKPERTI